MAAVAIPLQLPPSTLRDYVAEVDRIAALVEALDDAEDLSDAARERLGRELVSAIAGTRDKVDRTSSVIAQYEAAAAAAAKEIERLTARKKYFERQKERLEEYVLWILTTSRIQMLSGNTASFSSRKNPVSVAIDDVSQIPDAYLRYPDPPPPAPPRTAIRASPCSPAARARPAGPASSGRCARARTRSRAIRRRSCC